MQEPEGGIDTAGNTALRRYSVPQAARLLGISERAVRRRIERQTMRAERTGTRWTVIMEAVSGPVQGGIPTASSAGTEHEGGTQTADALRDVIREQQERIVQLSERVGELQAQLARDRTDTAIRRAGTHEASFPSQRPFWLWRIFGRR